MRGSHRPPPRCSPEIGGGSRRFAKGRCWCIATDIGRRGPNPSHFYLRRLCRVPPSRTPPTPTAAEPGSPSVLYPPFSGRRLAGRIPADRRYDHLRRHHHRYRRCRIYPPVPFPGFRPIGDSVTFAVVFTDYPTASTSSGLPTPTIGQP